MAVVAHRRRRIAYTNAHKSMSVTIPFLAAMLIVVASGGYGDARRAFLRSVMPVWFMSCIA
jgi:hypothetical protein